jgi:hypothetical protein
MIVFSSTRMTTNRYD